MTTSRASRRGFSHLMGNVANWPPAFFCVLGVVLLGIWALGTSVQVLTSEAWMMGRAMKQIDFTAFGQLIDAVTGHLLPDRYVPFMFGWGVQFALIVASVGIELPRHPAWRYWLSWLAVGGLIVINSCGDFASSSQYGVWGQLGFTLVVFFITFCMLLFSIIAFKHAWTLMKMKVAQADQAEVL